MDTINKNRIVSEVFLKEVLELRSRHWVLALGAIFILLLLLDYQSAEKQDDKKYLVKSVGPSGFKIVFALLTKAIVVEI